MIRPRFLEHWVSTIHKVLRLAGPSQNVLWMRSFAKQVLPSYQWSAAYNLYQYVPVHLKHTRVFEDRSRKPALVKVTQISCPNMTWSDLVEFDYTDYTILCIVFLVLLKQVTTSETASGRLSTAGTAAGQQFYRPWNGNFAPKNGTWHCRNAAEKGWHLAGWVHKKGGEQKKRTTHTLNHRLHRLLHRIQEGTGNDLYNLYTLYTSTFQYILLHYINDALVSSGYVHYNVL